MKRSEIDHYIDEAIAFFREHHFLLPAYAYYTPDEWKSHVDGAQAIFDLKLGWDVTSFGSGDFLRTGLLLFTLRNGIPGHREYCKSYAEKIMMVREKQITPCHFHWHKREDIINRGGGRLIVELFHADNTSNLLTGKDFTIEVSGVRRSMKSGEKLRLLPGESVCFEPCHAHRFYAEPGTGPVLAGEVSMVNDDSTDNCFVDGVPRFDPIEEDTPPRYLLGMEYATWLN